MDIRHAVKDKANYADIVAWFRSQGDMTPDQLVLLADTVDEMSEEVYEHYRGLCDIWKGQLQRIRRVCREVGAKKAFPEDSMRSQLAYSVEQVCRQGAVVAEKYVWLLEEFRD